MRVLDLFSGIGGFSVGLERAGMRTVAFCEIDAFCRRVLSKHWPSVPCYDDVRDLTGARLAADGIAVDVIAGGFPCQDISFAGKRAGLEGARSGLWGEYRRLIGEVRPRFVLVENVPGLLSLGMGTVLGDLSALGYDAVWDCVPASAVGAPHQRDRVWIVAYTNEGRRAGVHNGHSEPDDAGAPGPVADAIGDQLWQQPGRRSRARRTGAAQSGEHGPTQPVANADGAGCAQPGSAQSTRWQRDPVIARPSSADSGDWWAIEPDVGRVAHGVPARVDRLRSLGNSIVPQIAEMLGRVILAEAL